MSNKYYLLTYITSKYVHLCLQSISQFLMLLILKRPYCIFADIHFSDKRFTEVYHMVSADTRCE